MNGICLLFYVTLFAQATAPLGSSGSSGSQPTFGGPLANSNPSTAPLGSTSSPLGSTTSPLGSNLTDSKKDDSRTYGWQINEYRELEYIVQISPSLLSFMQNPADKQELASQIPPALIGRVKRVVVRIGNDVLPRTPLEEIEKLFPAIASLPPGKLKEMGSGTVINVNNASGSGSGSYPQPGTGGLNSVTTAPLGSTFADQARGTTSQPQSQGSLLDRFASNGTTISGQSSRFNNTAQTPYSQNLSTNRLPDTGGSLGSAQGYVPDLTAQRSTDPYAMGINGTGTSGYGTNVASTNGFGSNGYGSGALGSNGYASNPAVNQYGQAPPLRNDYSNLNNGTAFNNGLGYNGNSAGNLPMGYANDPRYNSTNDTAIAGQYPNRQGFGSTTGYEDGFGPNSNPLLNQRRLGNSYGDPNGLPSASGYLASNATTRSDLPGTNINPPGSERLLNPRQASAYRNELQSGIYPNLQTTDNNYFFYVFFILSVAVNLWMVHLLRSLYLRYRNLLSSLRSQATLSS